MLNPPEPSRVYKDYSLFNKGFMGSHIRRKGEWLASYASCRVVVPKPFNPSTLITQNPTLAGPGGPNAALRGKETLAS